MRIAVLIWGVQNSGKSSTFREIVNNYSGKNINTIRRGWQRLFLNGAFQYLHLDAYFFPSSPTETGLNLSTHFNNMGYIPEVIFVAEQINGQNAQNTLSFLNANNFHVLNYTLTNLNGSGVWDRFDPTTQQAKLQSRANLVISDIRTLLRNNQIV